ncbi:MAG: tetratricopeptide repeat protein [Desulfovibrio sp.]|uniref:tetratricopeptide repeat protein n=1 Tax=Desulfovibrio sp. 7SRBS1 TaxID=3378064 RepID=UPI003B41B484
MVGAKTIREHVARAKAYASRFEILKTLSSLCDALKLLNTSKVFGREKFEIEILIDEVLRTLSGMPQLKSIFPNGLSLKKGQEAQLYKTLRTVHDKIQSAIEKAEMEKMRAYKLSIDKAILTAQKFLDEENFADAKRIFRKAADKFADEPGIDQDIGGRLLRAGQAKDALEYLETAIEKDSRDARPYTHLVMAYEMLGELDKGIELTKDALRNFGPNDRTYLIQARLFFKLKKWDEAFDAAEAALAINPLANSAQKIIDKVKPRIFGKGKGVSQVKGKDGREKKVYTFDL